MTNTEIVGSVSELWRFPVKSMRGERLQEAEFIEGGLLGDRAYALIDVDSGKVVSSKSTKLFPDLFRCKATFTHPPQAGGDLPPVMIELPDGTLVESDSGDVDSALSACLGRKVTLARSAPENFTIDQYHPDLDGLDPEGHRNAVIEQKLGSAFFAEAGMDSPVPVGSFYDLFPVSVLTTSTLEELGNLSPGSRFDSRRFRMNVVVDTTESGFLENNWVGRELGIGDKTRFHIALPDPRCVMTTLALEDLPRDNDILRTLVKHNRIQVGGAGLFPCAGVYAVIGVPGTVSLGDNATLG